MATPPHIGKCRDLLGRLRSHGIEASRRTGAASQTGEPDALLVADDGRLWLVAILAGKTVQPQLLDDPAEPAPATLEATAVRLHQWRAAHQAEGLTGKPGLLVLAPALDRRELEAAPPLFISGEAVAVLPRQRVEKRQQAAESILSQLGTIHDEAAIAAWRAAVTPEVKIDPVSARRPSRETPSPTATVPPLLLDFRQERCARLDLEPDSEAARTGANLQIRLITGVAGCGKTLVLVHRAALLATHFPRASILIVTFNRPLIADLQRRVKRLGVSRNVHCHGFHQWLERISADRREIIQSHEIKRWCEQELASGAYGHLGRLTPEWMMTEVDWMFDHGHVTEDYLTVERKGRRTRLLENQRGDMLRLACRFREHLREQRVRHWQAWPLEVEEQSAASPLAVRYDHILIDEAQFFAPVWLRLLRQSLKPGGHFFLCADPTQGFLRRRMSWSEIGLDVRNRSHRLERPYRSTRAILEFARDFYQRRLPDDDEPLNLPSPEWMERIEPGQPPHVCTRWSSPDLQLAQVIQELRHLRDSRQSLENVLVLVAGRVLSDRRLVEQINRQLGPDTAALAKHAGTTQASSSVAHLMAATGLERSIVFLLGADELIAEEHHPGLSPDERAEKVQEHTRQLYVGLTRAMDRLIIYASHPALLEALGHTHCEAPAQHAEQHSVSLKRE